MTIRESNWCEDCEEECNGHSRVCTTCGGALTVRPSASTRNPPPSFRAMPDIDAFLPAGLSTAGLSTADVLASVRRQVQATTVLAQQAVDNNNNTPIVTNTTGDGWQAIPEALLDPQNGGGKTPTKKEVLNKLPREVLKENSACFFRVHLKVGNQEYEGVTGELGLLPSLKQQNETKVEAPLWIPSTRQQRTGKEALENVPDPPFVALLERGDGISFFTKAYAAECQGAAAVIIVNDKAEPWPYIMKDSRTRAQKDEQGEVSIPTVMVSQAHGREIVSNRSKSSTCSLTISHNPQDHATCVVCRDTLQLGQTTLTLANFCGHVFHEECALHWLKNHNTCPYCRRSLPTEEAGQESERRRQMTSNNSSEGGNGETFYS